MRFSAFLCIALLLGGCAASAPSHSAGGGVPASEPTVSDPEPMPQSDVLLDGISVLGEWTAIGALDEPDADRDLRSGMLVRRLTVERGGYAMLSGEDRREGTAPEQYEGRVTGNRLTFDDLSGEATLSLRSDGRLVFVDPRGRRTVYERG